MVEGYGLQVKALPGLPVPTRATTSDVVTLLEGVVVDPTALAFILMSAGENTDPSGSATATFQRHSPPWRHHFGVLALVSVVWFLAASVSVPGCTLDH